MKTNFAGSPENEVTSNSITLRRPIMFRFFTTLAFMLLISTAFADYDKGTKKPICPEKLKPDTSTYISYKDGSKSYYCGHINSVEENQIDDTLGIGSVSCHPEFRKLLQVYGEKSSEEKTLKLQADYFSEREGEYFSYLDKFDRIENGICETFDDGRFDSDNVKRFTSGESYHLEGIAFYLKAINCNSFGSGDCTILAKVGQNERFIIDPFEGMPEKESIIESEEFPKLKEVAFLYDGLTVVLEGVVGDISISDKDGMYYIHNHYSETMFLHNFKSLFQ